MQRTCTNSVANIEIEIDSGHDAIPTLLVDKHLDRLPIVRNRLVGAVYVRLLEDFSVESPHRGQLHGSQVLITDLRHDVLELLCGVWLQLRLP